MKTNGSVATLDLAWRLSSRTNPSLEPWDYSGYQPTKAEMEVEWDAPEGLKLEQITRAVWKPVGVRWVGKPRSRRR
ncbi:MAG: hypothetical protein OXN97_17225 [Bryobacterales bacterium]|nr:hypothetical protein [Bryobacterales bacterium]MDE0628702.1 hypothetical protein [Bryobacterales bacterium]